MSFIYNLLAGSTIFLSIVGYSVFRFSDLSINSIAFTRIHAIINDNAESRNPGIKLYALILIYKIYGLTQKLLNRCSRLTIENISLEGSRKAFAVNTQKSANNEKESSRYLLIQCLWNFNVQTILSENVVIKSVTRSLMTGDKTPQDGVFSENINCDILYHSFNQVYDLEFGKANEKDDFEKEFLPPNLFLMLGLISQRAFFVVSSHIIQSSAFPITWERYSDTFIDIYDNIFESSFEIDNDTEIEDDYELINMANVEPNDSNSNLRNRNMANIQDTTPRSSETTSIFSEKTLVGNQTPRSHKLLKKNESCKAGLDWVALGFQGNDPSTDFRGSGQFGVNCLEYMTSICGKTILDTLIESGSYSADADCGEEITSKPWYSFALVSIGLSRWIIDILQDNPGLIMKICYEGINIENLIRRTIPMDGFSTDSIDWSRPQGIKVERTLQELIVGYKNTLYNLNLDLVLRFHNYWKNQVREGKVRTVMDVEECMRNFKSSMINQKTFQTWGGLELSKSESRHQR